MKLKVFKADGSSSTEKDFPHFPEFEGDRGIATLRQVVIAQQANKRQGNASTKTRAEVAGSGKKLFRQKGSGTARQGSRRVPHQRHGGVAHGPKPRDYSQKTNRKMRQLAMQRALFDRASAGGLSVIEDLAVEAPKTKIFNNVLKNVYPKRCKVLVVDDTFEENTAYAARNIQGVSLAESGDLSVLDIVKFQNVIVSSKAIETIIARAADGKGDE
ncbi:MAG: 50S ribosomal protein L4 [Puniceicoccaceae bacterium MED-G32]|jgi:large subunit ribosomal protein L4|nr:MAG: 50S ribosomal protein L4 [Puniceicoccaceae bacterium MED-G32]CAI8260971.1 MAG: 50S ribosomal protein L4 [Puniceicoccaceae bacterium MED-G32]|tara:strand:+ start:1187 stop:1831 length:645 start_codon:yes stop_codon:yes gene_type:complete